jgi:hypothetical protein
LEDPGDSYFGTRLSDSLISAAAWQVEKVTSKIEKDSGTGFYISMLNVSVYAKRYNMYYLIVAIVPNVIVTCIAIISLWIPDIQTRISIEVTTLLTVMAVLWVVSANIPSTPVTSWLEKFVYTSMMICGVCMFESAISGTFQLRQSNVPHWQAKILVWLSNTRHQIFRKYFCFHTNVIDSKYLREMEMVNKNEIKCYTVDEEGNHADVEAVKAEGLSEEDRIAFNKFLWREKAFLLDAVTQVSITIAYAISMAQLFYEVI